MPRLRPRTRPRRNDRFVGPPEGSFSTRIWRSGDCDFVAPHLYENGQRGDRVNIFRSSSTHGQPMPLGAPHIPRGTGQPNFPLLSPHHR